MNNRSIRHVSCLRDASARVSAALLIMALTFAQARAAGLECCSEIELTYANGDVQLAGVLLTPVEDGEYPAAVVLQGSGASDRSNGWARLIAETLVKKGVAVLLTDKRGSGLSEGNWRTSSFEDLANDGLAGIAKLKEIDGIRHDQLGFIGLSQGGHVAPLAASMGDVQFVIDLVGGGLPMKEMLFHELEQTYRQHGLNDEAIEELQRMTALSFRYIESGEGFDDYAAYRDQITDKFGPQATETWPATADDVYWTHWGLIHDFDPMPYWREVVDVRGIPSFIGYGELDEFDNVPVGASVERLENELEGESLTVRVYPDTGHSLMDEALMKERQYDEWIGDSFER
jgi:pimeloyl-ACP methyl ester carboxylesterase